MIMTRLFVSANIFIENEKMYIFCSLLQFFALKSSTFVFVAANWANWVLNKFIAGVERNFGALVHLSCGLDFVEFVFCIFLNTIFENNKKYLHLCIGQQGAIFSCYF